MLTRDLQHGTRSTVKRGSHRTAQVMQSGVNPHTASRIVGYRITLKEPSSRVGVLQTKSHTSVFGRNT
ncbi:hypothetical protein YC2023_018895 [Brassica napus]